jgi:RND family efflux transporter MFP subunit
VNSSLQGSRKRFAAFLAAVLLLGPGIEASAQLGPYECMIEPEMVAELGSASPGLLSSVDVRRGDIVTAGQVLATLTSGVEEAAVAVAQARVDATSQLESAQVRREFSERKYQRTIELSEKNYASESDLDEARTEMVLAEKSLLEAEDALTLARAELRRAEELLELKKIRSPFDGVVVERYLNPGERVEDQPILRLAKVDPLRVEAFLPVEMINTVAEGFVGRITAEAGVSRELIADVTVVDTVVDAASGLFRVRLALPNSDRSINAGLACEVTFFPGGAELAEAPE